MLRTNHKRKSKEQKRLIPSSNLTFNLNQLSLPTSNGDPHKMEAIQFQSRNPFTNNSRNPKTELFVFMS